MGVAGGVEPEVEGEGAGAVGAGVDGTEPEVEGVGAGVFATEPDVLPLDLPVKLNPASVVVNASANTTNTNRDFISRSQYQMSQKI